MKKNSIRPRVRRHIERACAKGVLPRLDLLDSTINTFEVCLGVTLTIGERSLLVRCIRKQFANANDNQSHLGTPKPSPAFNGDYLVLKGVRSREVYRR